jgi:uncharacterized protein (DUF1697 family)
VSAAIALLRGINVGKGKPVAMADLAALVRGLGFPDARTLLRSGNIVFDARGAAPAALETLLETELKARLGLSIEVHVRTGAEWAEAIAHNPFPDEAKANPGRLLLFALKTAPKAGAIEAMQAEIPGQEKVRAWGRHAYIVYPDGVGSSQLSPALFARHLGRNTGTGRNWNTALKLAAMAG